MDLKKYQSYYEDRIEIEEINDLIGSVVDVFFNFFDKNNCWDYEIQDGGKSEQNQYFSYSTCSMILHSILTALGKIDDSFMSKGIRSRFFLTRNKKIKRTTPNLIKNLESVCKTCKDRIIEESNKETSKLAKKTFFKKTKELSEMHLAETLKEPELKLPEIIKNEFLQDIEKARQEYQVKSETTDGQMFYSSNFGKDDPFTLAWLLEVFSHKGEKESNSDNSHSAFLKKLSNKSIDVIEKAFKEINTEKPILIYDSNDKKPLEHAFPLLKIITICSILEKNKKANPIDFDVENRIPEITKKYGRGVTNYTLNRVHQHLSLSAIKDSEFDVAELVFSLEGYLLSVDGKKHIDENLLEQVFSIVENSQNQSAYWRPLKPFVTNKTGFVLLPLSIEIVNSLLRICSLTEEGENNERLFHKYVGIFKRYRSWLKNRVVKGTAKNSEGNEHCFTGWHSENVLEKGKIHPWDTSQILMFFLLYQSHMQKHISRKMIESSNFAIKSFSKKNTLNSLSSHDYWKEQWEKKEPVDLKLKDEKKIFEHIGLNFIKPRCNKEQINAIEEIDSSSMLLYGPAGTGKSTIAEEIAKSLDWDMITITPSNFIAKGEAEVENRAKEIFDILMEQEECVVLFDEIDRLILDRDSKLYQKQSDIFQFMTPGMLVKIKDLREKKNVIFIIATNYEDRIDPAIKRKGRIDHQYLISTPDCNQRKKIFIESMEKRDVNNKLESETNNMYEFLDETLFCKKTVLCTYGEIDHLATVVIDKFNESKDQKLKDILGDKNNKKNKPLIYNKPDLTLTSYKSRFKCSSDGKPGEFQQIQEPHEELLLLFYLKIKESTLDDKEKKFLVKILKNLSGNECADKTEDINQVKLKEKLQMIFKDDKIIEGLVDAIISENGTTV